MTSGAHATPSTGARRAGLSRRATALAAKGDGEGASRLLMEAATLAAGERKFAAAAEYCVKAGDIGRASEYMLQEPAEEPWTLRTKVEWFDRHGLHHLIRPARVGAAATQVRAHVLGEWPVGWSNGHEALSRLVLADEGMAAAALVSAHLWRAAPLPADFDRHALQAEIGELRSLKCEGLASFLEMVLSALDGNVPRPLHPLAEVSLLTLSGRADEAFALLLRLSDERSRGNELLGIGRWLLRLGRQPEGLEVMLRSAEASGADPRDSAETIIELRHFASRPMPDGLDNRSSLVFETLVRALRAAGREAEAKELLATQEALEGVAPSLVEGIDGCLVCSLPMAPRESWPAAESAYRGIGRQAKSEHLLRCVLGAEAHLELLRAADGKIERSISSRQRWDDLEAMRLFSFLRLFDVGVAIFEAAIPGVARSGGPIKSNEYDAEIVSAAADEFATRGMLALARACARSLHRRDRSRPTADERFPKPSDETSGSSALREARVAAAAKQGDRIGVCGALLEGGARTEGAESAHQLAHEVLAGLEMSDEDRRRLSRLLFMVRGDDSARAIVAEAISKAEAGGDYRSAFEWALRLYEWEESGASFYTEEEAAEASLLGWEDKEEEEESDSWTAEPSNDDEEGEWYDDPEDLTPAEVQMIRLARVLAAQQIDAGDFRGAMETYHAAGMTREAKGLQY